MLHIIPNVLVCDASHTWRFPSQNHLTRCWVCRVWIGVEWSNKSSLHMIILLYYYIITSKALLLWLLRLIMIVPRCVNTVCRPRGSLIEMSFIEKWSETIWFGSTRSVLVLHRPVSILCPFDVTSQNTQNHVFLFLGGHNICVSVYFFKFKYSSVFPSWRSGHLQFREWRRQIKVHQHLPTLRLLVATLRTNICSGG